MEQEGSVPPVFTMQQFSHSPERRAMSQLVNGSHSDAAPPLLVASGIKKQFDRIVALSGADFELAQGEVHGLLGANGAGKSTLSKAISGHVIIDGGQLTLGGQALSLRSTRDGLEHGIAMVMQETSLVPDLTVLENIFLPELGKPGRLHYGSLRRRAKEILDALGQKDSLALDLEVRSLSSAQKQLVEIAKALGISADLIIFDEPTASLSPGEVDRLFTIISKLRESGKGIIFVSHRLEEVFDITDRVTVMREGRTILQGCPTSSLTQPELIRAMVGSDLGAIYDRSPKKPDDNAPIVLKVEHLASYPEVKSVSFDVRQGEILGLGGLVGAGRSETVEAIFGLRKRDNGHVELSGRSLRANSPKHSILAGLGLVPEDRRGQSIVPDMTVRENLLLAHLGASSRFFTNYGSRRVDVSELCRQLDLPEDRLIDASLLNFSGGMQQKVIIARWLVLKPSVLVLDEPTKGVDIQTRAAIYEILRNIAARGVALIVVSSDFEELLGLSDRIVVISDGTSVADLPSTSLDEEKLTLLAAPRTSMTRNAELLRALAQELNGAAYWILIEDNELICLNSICSNAAADPGFRAGQFVPFGATQIPDALASRGGNFVPERVSGRVSLLHKITSRLGHDLGWIGLTLPGDKSNLSSESIKSRINAIAEDI